MFAAQAAGNSVQPLQGLQLVCKTPPVNAAWQLNRHMARDTHRQLQPWRRARSWRTSLLRCGLCGGRGEGSAHVYIFCQIVETMTRRLFAALIKEQSRVKTPGHLYLTALPCLAPRLAVQRHQRVDSACGIGANLQIARAQQELGTTGLTHASSRAGSRLKSCCVSNTRFLEVQC